MKQLLILVCAVVLAEPGPGLLADPTKPGPDYYPLKPGTKWDYQVNVGGMTVKVSNVIEKIEMVAGESQAVQKTMANGEASTTEYLSRNAKGIFRHKSNGMAVTPPVCLLKYPVKPGDTWEEEHVVEKEKMKEKIKISVKVGEYEEVQVPGGKFKTIPITLKAVGKGQTMETTSWFAPNVGMVKQTVVVGPINISLELEKFEAGK